MTSTYTYQKLSFNGYAAYFLLIQTIGFFGNQRTKFVPAMAHYINGKKNTCVRLSRFPTTINTKNFFYFIHAQDESHLNEFVREHPDINVYVGKLNEYLKSGK